MNRERRTNTRQRSRAPAWVAVALLLLLPMASHAQDGQPRSPYAVGFTTVGVHELSGCKKGVGDITGTVHPIGKLSNKPNAPVGWLLDRVRCDTAPRWVDLLLVTSSNGMIPPLENAVRLGPSREDSWTVFVGSGDFDNDGYLDIALRSVLAGDVSPKGEDIATVYVMWGNERGEYSILDTTELENDAAMWTAAQEGVTGDSDGDAIDDLVIRSGIGLDSTGKLMKTATILAYKGGERWGKQGSSRRASWRWWRVPKVLPSNSFGYWERRDADCDGVQDLVIYTNNVLGGTGGLQVIYGTASGGFPDTTAIDVLDFTPIRGARSVLSDVTGDGVPDLVVGCGERDVIEVFAGKPGQRLQELYGTGTDSADRATGRRPVRPWAHLSLPHAINDAWFRGTAAFNLGDADGDGVDEIWGESFPYIMGYRGLDALDSLGDIIYRGEVHYAYRIRDLYVNGFPVIVFTNNSRIGYYRIVEPPFPNSYTSYALPHDPDFRCQHASAVADGDPVPPSAALAFTVEPNPATAQQRITWQPTDGTATITVHTMQGEPIWTTTLAATNGVAIWQTDTLASGVYTITLTINTTSETQTTTITH
ncbi:MAG: T9SS type A sorting domain-containing protein [Armatimonadetes bacterium]|nr:T9SS type A sorting domain-containing protein [Armatimonadota bacterium]